MGNDPIRLNSNFVIPVSNAQAKDTLTQPKIDTSFSDNQMSSFQICTADQSPFPKPTLGKPLWWQLFTGQAFAGDLASGQTVQNKDLPQPKWISPTDVRGKPSFETTHDFIKKILRENGTVEVPRQTNLENKTMFRAANLQTQVILGEGNTLILQETWNYKTAPDDFSGYQGLELVSTSIPLDTVKLVSYHQAYQSTGYDQNKIMDYYAVTISTSNSNTRPFSKIFESASVFAPGLSPVTTTRTSNEWQHTIYVSTEEAAKSLATALYHGAQLGKAEKNNSPF